MSRKRKSSGKKLIAKSIQVGEVASHSGKCVCQHGRVRLNLFFALGVDIVDSLGSYTNHNKPPRSSSSGEYKTMHFFTFLRVVLKVPGSTMWCFVAV